MAKKNTAVEQAYSILKEQIVTLKLKPGQLLMVQQLALEMGLSRTPVREALIRLSEELFVTETDGNKFKVSEISWKWIEDNYNVRSILEEAAISYAAKNATSEQIQQLEKITDQMAMARDAMDYAAYFELDCSFHKSIVAISNNIILSRLSEQTSDHQQRIRYCTMGKSAELQRSFSEHSDMVRYIREHKVEEACSIAKTHLERALNDMMLLKEGIGWLN
jgi:DNA-binding GntR family transcriptional regulator